MIHTNDRWRTNGCVAALLLLAACAVSAGAQQAVDVLPAGPGHDLVQSVCVACHELNRITRSSGYDHQGWSEAVDRMVAVGAPLQPGQKAQVVDYLASHFPEQPKPPGVALPGPARVSFREWTVPTPGSRPHDPFGAPDGSLWWTGHMGNRVGRLDPATGQMREYTPTVAKSGPHGIVMDAQGKVWFTANFQGYIGRLDPATGAFTEYPIPDPAVKDPHTPKFDQDGILWFTAQSANVVGRLDPKTGQFRLATSPTPRSNPYGMVITRKGVPVFDEFGTNKIGAIDPRSMAIREYPLPNADARPRRIAITSDDTIWYTDYARGFLGRLDLASGAVREWASPGGPQSQPYAITALHDVIWYVESNTRPNMLVRFEPASGKFQSWPIPSGGGVVRNMTPLGEGALALAESGVNKVAVAKIE